MTTDAPPQERKPLWRHLRGTLVFCGLIYAADGVVVGGFGVGTLLALTMVPAALIRGWRRKDPGRMIALRALLPVIAVLAVFGTIAFNMAHSRAAARRIISAAESFRHEQGHYPSSLEELVPRYLPQIPRARYTVLLNEFSYRQSAGQHVLGWMVLPPFGSAGYFFEQKQWGESF